MGRLIYSMFTSLDGYASGPDGSSDWGGADAEVHAFLSDQMRAVGTYLYGRRMYEVMAFWQTAHELPDAPDFVREFAAVWQAADKVVYSTTLDAPTTPRTRVERAFDPAAVRALVTGRDHDVTIDGPTLAAHALRAGLVDEVQPLVAPVSVGGGLRFWPDGLRLDLALADQHRFANGTVWLRYERPSTA